MVDMVQIGIYVAVVFKCDMHNARLQIAILHYPDLAITWMSLDATDVPGCGWHMLETPSRPIDGSLKHSAL